MALQLINVGQVGIVITATKNGSQIKSMWNANSVLNVALRQYIETIGPDGLSGLYDIFPKIESAADYEHIAIGKFRC